MRRYYSADEIKQMAEENRLDEFYNSRGWRTLAEEILKEQNGECQLCKARGRYSPATTVHHVQHLRERPDLAYARYYMDSGALHRQLLALCRACHERKHERSFAPRKEKFTNAERW